jgi:hypothetical protein
MLLTINNSMRLPTTPPGIDIIPDVEKCVQFLNDFESRWSGARRSKAIVEQLLAEYRQKATTIDSQESRSLPAGIHLHAKRSFAEFESSEAGESEMAAPWPEIPGWELFADAGLFGV